MVAELLFCLKRPCVTARVYSRRCHLLLANTIQLLWSSLSRPFLFSELHTSKLRYLQLQYILLQHVVLLLLTTDRKH